jgi:hypothetical protein
MKKIKSEKETRANILEIARQLGCEGDILKIFHKYDMMLRNCTNPMERQAISIAGNEEVHFLLSSRPGFILVGNKVIGKE